MLRRELEKRKRFLESLIPQLKKWLEDTPKWSLRISRSRYYVVRKKNDTTGTRTMDLNLVRILSNRQYYLKVLKRAQIELVHITKLLKTKQIATIYSELREERKKLVTPLEKTVSEIIVEWLKQEDVSLPIKPGKYGIKTKRGDFVRSKAEMKIADALFESNIPYKMDVEFGVDNFTSYWVDFQIINPNTGEFFYWEHMGMMNNPDYVSKNIKKLDYYASKGLYPGKNLILTFENNEYKLDERHIQRIIKDLLL